MGAREELLAAAHSLADSGTTLFTPAELIARARAEGSQYPDSTLRTHVVSVMCSNAPVNHGTTYGDLERVGRGLYRLTSAAPLPVVVPSVPLSPRPQPQAVKAAVIEHDDEWFWEGNVQAMVVGHLARQGWEIRRVANTATSEHGIDIEATREGTVLLVEVKGYPGTTYARGARKGEAKRASVATQARTYFSNALLAGLLMRSESPDARVVLAFPEMTTFSNLTSRVRGPLHSAGIEVWTVSEHGVVAEFD